VRSKPGLRPPRAAVELNPWYSPWLWNVLGDCLLSMERPEEAHECCLQAHRIHAQDVKTNLSLRPPDLGEVRLIRV
jgi:hypothetical protein